MGLRTPLQVFDKLFKVGNCKCSSCRYRALTRGFGKPLALMWKTAPTVLLALILWRVW